ncbi:MAG: apolipoprotein N-acyltransferase, partial [Candidatus Bathyarchaeota archaeon]
MTRISIKNVVLAGLSGLMLTASFAPIDLHWIAWISLFPLLMSLEGKSPVGAFKSGLFAGLLHYLTLIYWIVVVLSRYGNLTFMVSLTALFLLSSYCAIFMALFALIVVSLKKHRLSSFWGASIWVALEYTRAHIMTGFPWCLLGYSQYSRLPLIQISDIAGVYSMSFIIVLVNIVLYNLVFILNSKKKKPIVVEAALASFLIGFILFYGYHSLKGKAEDNPKGKGLRAVIVQGNIDQSVKWSPNFQEKTVAIYKKLSEKSTDFKPHIIIWPETALPFFFQDSSYLSKEVFETAKTVNSKILFGSPAYVKNKDTILYYNRAYIISGNGVL